MDQSGWIWTRTENLSAGNAAPPVRRGGFVFPACVAWVAEHAETGAQARIVFEMRHGRAICTAVCVESPADAQGVRTGDLARLPGLDALAASTFEHLASKADPGEGGAAFDWFIGASDLATRTSARRDFRAAPRTAQVETAARVYRENIHGAPTAAVEEALDVSRRTAVRRINEARALGLLPPTTQGKRKA